MHTHKHANTHASVKCSNCNQNLTLNSLPPAFSHSVCMCVRARARALACACIKIAYIFIQFFSRESHIANTRFINWNDTETLLFIPRSLDLHWSNHRGVGLLLT